MLKSRGTSIDLVSDDWLEIVRGGGLTFAQLSYDFAMEHAEYVRELLASAVEHGVTIWGRLPDRPEDARRLIERGIFYDAALAEFAEDPEELEARFSSYDEARPSTEPVLRGIVVESRRGIAALPEILDRVRVDLVLPGPFDLSKELGLTPEHPEVQAEVLGMIEICAEKGVDVIASVTTHPGGAVGAAASAATRLIYPGVRRAAELAWQGMDEAIAEGA